MHDYRQSSVLDFYLRLDRVYLSLKLVSSWAMKVWNQEQIKLDLDSTSVVVYLNTSTGLVTEIAEYVGYGAPRIFGVNFEF